MKKTNVLVAMAATLIAHSVIADYDQEYDLPAKNVNVTNDVASPIPVTVIAAVSVITEYRYVGLTSHADDGDFEFGFLRGRTAMNKACAADFGPTARVATIAEAFFRDDAATEPRDGWLGPDDGPIIFGRLGFSYNPWTDVTTYGSFPIDAESGVRIGANVLGTDLARQYAFCGYYSENKDFFDGPVIEATGLVVPASCNIIKPVACSAPVVATIAD